MDVVHPRINRWSLSGVASRMTASGFPCDTEIFLINPRMNHTTLPHAIIWLCLIGCSKSCCFRMMCLMQNGCPILPHFGDQTPDPTKGAYPPEIEQLQWKMAHKKEEI